MFDKLIGKFGFESREQFWQFVGEGIRFCIVGVVNTIVFYAVYLLFLDVLHVNLYVSYILAFIIATFNSYILGNIFVFKKKDAATGKTVSTAKAKGLFDSKRMLRVYLSYGVTLLLGLGLVWVDVNVLDISEKLAPLVNLLITTPTNFFLNKLWAYRD